MEPKDALDPTKLDAYKTALQTRNFEIGLFWQRSNYFLVLNTAIGTGFFTIRSDEYAILLGVLGVVASCLWLLVNLGGKFWQSRWERQLETEEEELAPAFKGFFAGSSDDLRKAVEESLDRDYPIWRIDRRTWYWAVLKRPSVSLMMTYLSCAFVIFWLAAIAMASIGDHLR